MSQGIYTMNNIISKLLTVRIIVHILRDDKLIGFILHLVFFFHTMATPPRGLPDCISDSSISDIP